LIPEQDDAPPERVSPRFRIDIRRSRIEKPFRFRKITVAERHAHVERGSSSHVRRNPCGGVFRGERFGALS
jgi:hypothetical protein